MQQIGFNNATALPPSVTNGLQTGISPNSPQGQQILADWQAAVDAGERPLIFRPGGIAGLRAGLGLGGIAAASAPATASPSIPLWLIVVLIVFLFLIF